MVPGPNRRTLLSAAAGLAATALAGCTETSPTGTPGDGSSGLGGSALFDPDDLMEASQDGFLAVDGAAYRQGSSTLPTEFTDGTSSIAERHGLQVADVDRFTVFGGFDRADSDSYGDDRFLLSAVATGTVDADAAADAVSDREQVSEVGTHRGATVYARSTEYDDGRSKAYAVSGETLVGAAVDNGRAVRNARRRVTDRAGEGSGSDDGTPTPEDDPPEEVSTAAGPGDGATARMAVERHLDALAGGDEGYPGVEAPLENSTAPLVGGARVDGDRLVETMHVGSENDVDRSARALLTGLTAVGLTGSVSADEEPPASLSVDLRYESGDDVTADAVESFVTALREASDSAAAALEHVEIGTDASGDTVTVAVDADPEAAFSAFSESSGRGGSRAPQVSFGFELRDDGRVTVTHEGGDTVREVVLFYAENESRGEERWTEGDDEIVAGDSYTTGRAFSSGTILRVVWESPDGGSSATLARFEVPE